MDLFKRKIMQKPQMSAEYFTIEASKYLAIDARLRKQCRGPTRYSVWVPESRRIDPLPTLASRKSRLLDNSTEKYLHNHRSV